MTTLVITGGIGSGKSAVCRHFALKGIPVYDSDSRTKSIYDKDINLASQIESVMGQTVTLPDGKIDRKALASVVFASSEKLELLESLVHPAVKSDFIAWRDEQDGVPFVVLESAIVLEKPLFDDITDFLLLVDAPLETRIARACERDGVRKELVLDRIANQKLLNDISLGIVVPDVDYIIVNDSDFRTLFSKADFVYDSLAGCAQASQK